MATFHTVWSIDLGKASLKAVKLRRESNNIEILAVDKLDYPIGTNGVDTAAAAKEALNAFKIRNDVREPVVVAHPGQGTFSRFIKVPAFDSKKLKEVVGYEASQQIPFPLDEVIWDYHIVNREYLSGEEREVGLFAVRKEAIDDYLLDFNSEGLSVEVLSIGYLGLLNYIFFDLAPKEPSIVLDIGATHTDLILVDGKRFWIRALPHSGNDINKAIMERFKLSFAEAEKLKIEAGKAPQQAAKIFTAVIQPKLKELVGEIHRSSGYYRSQAGDVKFQNLFLLGGGSKILGIKRYLQEQLGVQVQRVQSIQHFRVSRDVDLKLLQSELPSFATAFGCSLQGVGAGTCRVDLVPQEERIQKDLRRKRKHAFIAMGIVYAATIFAGFTLNGKIDRTNNELQTHINTLKETILDYGKSTPKAKGATAATKTKKGAASRKKDEEPAADTPAAAKSEIDWRDLDGITKAMRGQKEELLRVAEIRSLSLRALESLGAVVPKENPELVREVVQAPVDEKAPSKDEKKAEQEARAKLTQRLVELKKLRLFIPWLRIERIDWSPDLAAGAPAPASRERDREKEKKATVPAYKVTIFAAVANQEDTGASQKLLRDLLVEPLKKKLKELKDAGQPVTLDTDVYDSAEFSQTPPSRLPYLPKGAVADAASIRKRRDLGIDLEAAQAAGPFFGTEVSWIMRLRDVEAPAVNADGSKEDEPKKTTD